MSWKFLILGDSLSVSELAEPPIDAPVINVGEREFTAVTDVSTHEVLFYDFVADENEKIFALQIQVSRDDSVSTFVRGSREDFPEYIEFTPCLRIWLYAGRTGRELGLEAFADELHFFKDSQGIPAVAFPAKPAELLYGKAQE